MALHRPARTGPALPKSCTTPAIALGSVGAGAAAAIRFAITGPATGTYVIAVDATAARVDGGRVTVTPAGALAIAVRQRLAGCTFNGTLPPLSAGPHQVLLFRDGHPVARARLLG